ncbi:MAG TPA: hypothetical protein GXZ22_08380 [Clostridiaceae bacterium]|nr:hypothetical protein [Clostridiaceae bacterium]
MKYENVPWLYPGWEIQIHKEDLMSIDEKVCIDYGHGMNVLMEDINFTGSDSFLPTFYKLYGVKRQLNHIKHIDIFGFEAYNVSYQVFWI